MTESRYHNWGGARIRIAEFQDFDFVKDLEGEWEVFQERADPSVPYLRPDYLSLWLDILGGSNRPRIITIWEGGELVGYAPLMETPPSLGSLFLPSLKFIGNNLGGPGDILYADIVAVKPRDEIIRAVLTYLRGTTDPLYRWDFGLIRSDSSMFEVTAKYMGWAGQEHHRHLSLDHNVVLNLPQTEEEYLQVLSRNSRQKLRRFLRKLEERGNLTLTTDREPKRVVDRISEMLANHDHWWQGTSREGIYGGKLVREFYRSSAHLLAQNDMYIASTLELDDEPVAWWMGVCSGERYLFERTSYDQDFSALSPGFVLGALVMKDLVKVGVRRVDLCPGVFQYKLSLGGEPVPYWWLQGHYWTPTWLREMVARRPFCKLKKLGTDWIRASS